MNCPRCGKGPVIHLGGCAQGQRMECKGCGHHWIDQ